ncbi:MAG: peptidylprolyl isomerase [Candidatus ainarchaeum sp.]|nr:peptidylprolyl isomerase [Candidatus ainarchaeum sp.]MDD3975585.1 peptidylprolyl isomerase [Candidatus ainarchaeum sp.]
MKTTKIIIYVLCVILVLAIIFAIFKITTSKDIEGTNMDENKSLDVNESENTFVTIRTNKGDIEVELFDKNAPVTVFNFLEYVKVGFYDETIFHRVIKDFMIQGGGFFSDGTKKDNFDPILLETTQATGLSNKKGTIAMARTPDPNSATSQFFINTVDNDFLDFKDSKNPGYAVFGKVVSGMDVVMQIENAETTSKDGHQDWPVEDIIIEDVFIH